ncbi:uncharacterized protein CLUP02_00254 [Colletotrichum lupini]|uniref:Uncharacterized protein n=1 Tax=Colletotrichum lupini TaxID=145971 RepID=A0A9Q8S9V6_9PEZI|nr:uncharacterized protein CLUP02_00254 [Colletotrichum lupini]UQC73609.1 hypothetical protein CLUP02_00254 [Colletotrichum lupini]
MDSHFLCLCESAPAQFLRLTSQSALYGEPKSVRIRMLRLNVGVDSRDWGKCAANDGDYNVDRRISYLRPAGTDQGTLLGGVRYSRQKFARVAFCRTGYSVPLPAGVFRTYCVLVTILYINKDARGTTAETGGYNSSKGRVPCWSAFDILVFNERLYWFSFRPTELAARRLSVAVLNPTFSPLQHSIPDS